MAGTAATGVLEGEALDELRAGFRGEVLEPDDAEYESACVIFNGMFERRPAVVLRPAGTADVIRAVGLARLSGAELAVRGGGHSVAGFSLCDGGIVVDMRGMRGIRVDPRGRTVRAQAGLDWGQFDRETQAFGLATTGGRVTTTGVTGFTLGGGNCGIVTELEFRLAPVGPVVYGGLAAFPPEKTVELVRTWRDLSAEADDDLGWAVASITAPPEPFVPEEWRLKRMVGVAGMYAGPPEKAEQVLAPIRALGPVVDLWQPMPYTVVQGLLDPANPYGRRNYWRAFQLRCLDESAIDLFAARADAIPSPFTAFIIMNGGGAIGRVGENDTALGGRSNPFNVHANGMWEGDADEENIAWVRETTAAFAPHVAPGMALNFMTEIGDAELQESWGPKLQRLRELKAKYDPENLFRLNQNVLPAAT